MTEGVGSEAIEAKLVDWGFRRGPIASVQALGPDRVLRVQQVLAHAFGDRHGVPPSVERAMETFAAARPRPRSPGVAGRDIVERCVMRMVNEAVLCFGEGVIRSARDANVGAVLGAGFPAFRGGPLRYVDEVGIVEVTRRLQRLARAHGRRFAPAPLLVQMCRSGGTFHGQARVEPGSDRGGAIR
jgi:3-hydroxyacyl-CoA dehydrogenase/enoyl-CoA hydratase/3-hydroxybutyryl-CoA epimerase